MRPRPGGTAALHCHSRSHRVPRTLKRDQHPSSAGRDLASARFLEGRAQPSQVLAQELRVPGTQSLACGCRVFNVGE